MRNTKQYRSLPYNPALKQRAKALRRAGNISEVLLWNELKNKQFSGIDFDRQKIIGNFIVDFYCAEKQIVIEIDGSSHNDKVEYDKERDAFLERLDLTVVHFLDSEIKTNLSGVMQYLQNHPALAGAINSGPEFDRKATTPPLRGTPPKEGNKENQKMRIGNSPPSEGWQAKPDGVVTMYVSNTTKAR
jgi:very-short-patch-repair endonuclease